jgi:FtsP/CotA-like multicopper oxidase with cupredoxin domain
MASLALAGLQFPARAQSPGEVALDGFRVLQIRPTAPATGTQTTFWGYNGTRPGPTLRVRRGEQLRVRLVNGLSEPTTVHWHGVRLPNAMDRSPLTREPVRPGMSFDYRFTPPDAGTFLYHASPAQTAQGLAGLLIVEESEPVQVGGETALIFQDAGPAPDGPMLVNGVVDLDIPAPAAERTRLRLANAGARLLRIQIGETGPDELRTWVMATDGQPAEPFLARASRISLAPGNRADVFVEMTGEPGTKVPISVQAGTSSAAQIARLVLEGPSRTPPGLTSPANVKPLPANALPQRLDLARAQRVTVPTNPLGAPPRMPLFSVRRERVVVLALTNRSDLAHVVHLHGHSARLLDRLDDGWKPFWLDTLLVEPRQTERLAFLADNPGKWAIDARTVDGNSAGLAGWFEVT